MKQQSVDTIVKNFKSWVNSNGNNKETFYVGITNDINSAQTSHNVMVKFKPAKAYSVYSAILVLQSLKSWGCCGCEPDENKDFVYPYIYKKTKYTIEE